MAKYSKKGKTLCAVDGWLDTLGFYRKNVAYDETCLFRAVSEQLYNCQIYHEKVRQECIAYARTHFFEFVHLVESKEIWENRLKNLEKHMLFCGPIELQVISKKYEKDIIIFEGNKQQVINVTNKNLPEALFLCLMEEDHYDVVYTKEHIVNAGFCQSIVYKMFYEDIFKIEKVDDIVRNMLYEKHNLFTQQCENLRNHKEDYIELTDKSDRNHNIAPFPFKVAKALDPNIYRNIEYDAWGDTRRELRLGEWYYGDDKLILGTKCVYNDVHTGQTFDCYIQELKVNEDRCVVYITKTAQKLIVNYSDLSPEDDAKPWPLPYRFTKNLNISSTQQTICQDDKIQKNKKRVKDKKRTKSESCTNVLDTNLDPIDNINVYIGAPLRMQNLVTPSQQTTVVSIECQTDPVTEENTPEVEQINQSSQWQFLPPPPDPFVWPPTTPVHPPILPSQYGFGLKPMIASAPVTPDVVPYHDVQFPFFCNYHVDPYIYGQTWSNVADPLSSPSSEETNPDSSEQVVNIKTEINPEPVSSTPKQLKLLTNLTPTSPTVDVFSPILQIPPGTPVMYTPLQISDSEVLMHTPQMVYNSQLEMSYIPPPPPFIYPPTPPATWYPPGVNAQGFIFP